MLELQKSPVAHQPAHVGGITVRSLPDPRKGLKGECLPCCKRGLYQMLTDNVVGVANEPGLLPSDLLQSTFRALTAILLQTRTKVCRCKVRR